MAVPAEIRAVPRPKNTVVCNTGRPGPKQYPVRERAGEIYIAGGNPQPRNGRVIGHIFDNKFIALQQRIGNKGPDSLSFGSVALVKSVIGDLEEDLYAEMDIKDAQIALVAAMLRVIHPGIVLNRYSTYYNLSFARIYYPGLGLSSGVIEDIEGRLGQDGELRKRFFNRRFARVLPEHKIAIDGTLKQDTSEINSLSAYSHKARIKGCRDISVLYAYDVDLKEPICSQVFPGNSIDAVSYREFIKTNNITKGIIIADKGFPPDKISEELLKNKELHFLTPIKLNDKRIAQYKMLEPAGIVPGLGKSVTCKKQALPDGHYLYAFRDVRLAGSEDDHYVERALKNNDFDSEKYQKVQERFGVIIFESDKDLSPRDIYRCYSERWELELVFRYYKSNVDLDKTGAQADFEVIGSEFINFIASVLTCRIIAKMSKSGVLDRLSYKVIMHDLFTAFRKIGHEADATENDDYWVHTLPKVMDTLVSLKLAKPVIIESGSESKSDVNDSQKATKTKDSLSVKENPAKGMIPEKKRGKRKLMGPRDPNFVGPHRRWGRRPKKIKDIQGKTGKEGRRRVSPEADHSEMARTTAQES